jgi:hypothetical protein
MIIFNEKRYVEENVLTPAGRITNNKELLMFIRYYAELGCCLEEIWSMAIEKADRYEAVYDTITYDFLFTDAYNKAIKRKQYANEPTSVTKCEYEWIRQANDVEKEKILFTLLIIQKFLNLEFIKITYKDLRELALTKKRPDAIRKMVDELQNDGFLKRITDKTYGVAIPRCDSVDEFIIVTDYNHIPAPYLRTLRTESYYFCEWCAVRVRYSGSPADMHKSIYCEKCKAIKNKIRHKS